MGSLCCLPFGLRSPPSPSLVPTVCVLCPSVPILPLVSQVGELFWVCGSFWYFPPSRPIPQQTSLSDHMFFLPEPLAGLYPKPWDNAPSLPYAPQNSTPSEVFHREEEKWLPSKESASMELIADLATLEGNIGLLWLGHPRADPLETKDHEMSEALPTVYLKKLTATAAVRR